MAGLLSWLVGLPSRPLRAERITLVEPRLEHFAAWSALRQQSRAHLEPFEPAWAGDELTFAAYRRRLRRYRRERRGGTGATFFVFIDGGSTLVGGVSLANIRYGVTQSAMVGYWIGRPFIRRGYAGEAVAAVLKFAFEDLELNRLEAACMPANLASIRVLERGGFRREGVARRYLKINNVFEDHLLFARLHGDVPVAREWRTQSADRRDAPTRAEAEPSLTTGDGDMGVMAGQRLKGGGTEGRAA